LGKQGTIAQTLVFARAASAIVIIASLRAGVVPFAFLRPITLIQMKRRIRMDAPRYFCRIPYAGITQIRLQGHRPYWV